MEELRKEIEEWLKTRKFEYHEDKEKPERSCWYLLKWSVGPSQTIIINGERQDIPPQQIPVGVALAISGDGWIEDEDGSNHKDFLQMNIMGFQGESIVPQMVCIYNMNDFTQSITNVLGPIL